MITKDTFRNEREWLTGRKIVGGSDAASIIGLNPWKSNYTLWLEKTGRKKPDDLSYNELVQYGKAAEEPLRQLFALDYKKTLAVHYEPFNLFTNSEYPWAHASLDGWAEEIETGRWGVLEFKTATISSAAQSSKWKDGIPQNYYCQLLHYLAITNFEFAILTAQLKYDFDEEPEARTKHYRLERADVLDEIEYLMEQERIFAGYVERDEEPPTILPDI